LNEKADIADFRSADYFGTINLKDYIFFGSEKVNMAERGLYFIDKILFGNFLFTKGQSSKTFINHPTLQVIDNTIYYPKFTQVCTKLHGYKPIFTKRLKK
jgi:hypothetical protein